MNSLIVHQNTCEVFLPPTFTGQTSLPTELSEQKKIYASLDRNRTCRKEVNFLKLDYQDISHMVEPRGWQA